jgi:Spy/CpxP family protein refolding chaperone
MTNRTKAIIGLGSVFVLGGLCGALIFGVVIRDRVHEAQDLRNQGGFIEYFEKRLELTEAQRDSLHDELAHAYEQLAQLRFNASMEYNEVIDSLRVKIYPHLTPEQRELFNMQEQKFRHFMPREQMRGRPGGMHPPPPLGAVAPSPRAPETTAAPRSLATAPPAPVKPPPEAAKPSEQQPAETAVQPDASPEEQMMNKIRDRIQKVRQRLHLTDDQMRQILAIFDDARTRVRQARIDYEAQPIMRQMTVRGIARDAHRKVGALLTPEQRDEMQKVRDELRAKKLGGGPGETGKNGLK